MERKFRINRWIERYRIIKKDDTDEQRETS